MLHYQHAQIYSTRISRHQPTARKACRSSGTVTTPAMLVTTVSASDRAWLPLDA
jgi:hypothetical protein